MSDLPTAFVLLDRAIEPDMAAVAEALRARHPGLRVELVANSSRVGPNERSRLLRCGDGMIAVMPMPGPIPQDPGLWARAAATWPEAKAVTARHQGHVIVSSLGNR